MSDKKKMEPVESSWFGLTKWTCPYEECGYDQLENRGAVLEHMAVMHVNEPKTLVEQMAELGFVPAPTVDETPPKKEEEDPPKKEAKKGDDK